MDVVEQQIYTAILEAAEQFGVVEAAAAIAGVSLLDHEPEL